MSLFHVFVSTTALSFIFFRNTYYGIILVFYSIPLYYVSGNLRSIDNYASLISKLFLSLSNTLGYLVLNLLISKTNAKVGNGFVQNLVGRFIVGDRNDRGNRLQENNFILTNAFFKLPKRRLHAWKSLTDGHINTIVRNQIDYILVKERHRNAIKSVNACTGCSNSRILQMARDTTSVKVQ